MKKLHLVCNAHIDTIWQWEWAEGMSATLSTFQSAANLMEMHDYIFCHDEVFWASWICGGCWYISSADVVLLYRLFSFTYALLVKSWSRFLRGRCIFLKYFSFQQKQKVSILKA